MILTHLSNTIKKLWEKISCHKHFKVKTGVLRTNVASVGSVFNDTRKVKVLSLPETTKEKSTFRAKALLIPDKGPSLVTSIFPLSFQVVREPLPFAYQCRQSHKKHRIFHYLKRFEQNLTFRAKVPMKDLR